MKKFTKILFVSLLALALAACGGTKQDDSKIYLGANLDLTGGGQQYGEAELEGIELAVKLYNDKGGFNGKLVEVILKDAKSTPAEAYLTQTTLTEEGVFAVVGATVSGTTAQAVVAAGETEVPVVSPAATADNVVNNGEEAFPFGYRVCYSDIFQAITMANFTQDKGYKKVAVIGDSSSDYAQGLSEKYIEQAEKNGIEVIMREYFTEGDDDYSNILTKVKANTEIEALFIPGYYGTVGPLLKQANDLGIVLPVLGVDGYESDEFIELAGAAALNNVFYTSHYSGNISTPVHDEFVKEFKAMFNKEPNAFAALAYDATNLIFEALERAGEVDPIKVNDAIKATVDFEGVTGVISVDELHNANKATFVVELKDGVEVNATIVEP